MGIEDVERKMKSGEDWIAVSLADLTAIFRQLRETVNWKTQAEEARNRVEQANHVLRDKIKRLERERDVALQLAEIDRRELGRFKLEAAAKADCVTPAPEFVTRDTLNNVIANSNQWFLRIARLEDFVGIPRTNP